MSEKNKKWVWEKVKIELTNSEGEKVTLNSLQLNDVTFDGIMRDIQEYVKKQGGELE